MIVMRLTENFSLEQLTFSDTAHKLGIDNAPPPAIIENLQQLAVGLEGVQALLGFNLSITSAYRCKELKIGRAHV